MEVIVTVSERNPEPRRALGKVHENGGRWEYVASDDWDPCFVCGTRRQRKDQTTMTRAGVDRLVCRDEKTCDPVQVAREREEAARPKPSVVTLPDSWAQAGITLPITEELPSNTQPKEK